MAVVICRQDTRKATTSQTQSSKKVLIQGMRVPDTREFAQTTIVSSCTAQSSATAFSNNMPKTTQILIRRAHLSSSTEIPLRGCSPKRLRYARLELESQRLLAPDLPASAYKIRMLCYDDFLSLPVTSSLFKN